ncbi:hypothetical protein [Chryseobacterium sp.]|uniref:MNIO class RiPP chryseobasin precursor ChrA n=1 Tax=Chryseobacterium sp. TaxID=1871047 RepID=UPI0025C39906|nr:hypothetical protein [Chryseobacterium sp.]
MKIGILLVIIQQKTFMKIPALLMASLVTVGMSAQTTKPVKKKTKKTVKTVKTAEVPKTELAKAIAKKDTVIHRPARSCPACGLG